MLFSRMSPEEREAANNYIHERFWQLNNLIMDYSQRAQRYCFVVNAGGAVAALSYLAATKGEGVIERVEFSLVMFILGILFIAGTIVNLLHRTDKLLHGWRKDTAKFYLDQIQYETFLKNDEDRLGSDVWAYIFGYFSFACFIIGVFPHVCQLIFG